MDVQTFSTASAAPEYCLFGFSHWAACMPRNDWAAWVQAVGSLLGLAIAVTIAYQQMRHTRQVQSPLDAGRLEARAVLLDHIANAVQMMHDEHLTGNPRRDEILREAWNQMHEAAMAFAKIGLETATSEIEATALVDARKKFVPVAQWVNNVLEAPLAPDVLEKLLDAASGVRDQAVAMRRKAGQLKAT